MSSEKERLLKEAEFYTNLINSHKSQQVVNPPHTQTKATIRTQYKPTTGYQHKWNSRGNAASEGYNFKEQTKHRPVHKHDEAQSGSVSNVIHRDVRQNVVHNVDTNRGGANHSSPASRVCLDGSAKSQVKQSESETRKRSHTKNAPKGPQPCANASTTADRCKTSASIGSQKGKSHKPEAISRKSSNVQGSVPGNSPAHHILPGNPGDTKCLTASNPKVVTTTEKIETAQKLLLQIKKEMGSAPAATVTTVPHGLAHPAHGKTNLPQHPSKYRLVRNKEAVGPLEHIARGKSSSLSVPQHHQSTRPTSTRSSSFRETKSVVRKNERNPHLPNSKYKYVRGQVSTPAAKSQPQLSSLVKSPTMVVKLRTKYKLVKKAKQVRQKRLNYTTLIRKRNTRIVNNMTYSGRVHQSPRDKLQASAHVWTNTFSTTRNRFPFSFMSSRPKYYMYTNLKYSPYLGKRKRLQHDRRRWKNPFLFQNSPVNFGTQKVLRYKTVNDSKSTRQQMITVVGGNKYLIGKKGKSLKRLDKSVSHLKSAQAKLPTITQVVASRALHRSIYNVSYAKTKLKSKVQEYCKFYNRFGRCSRGVKCKFIHDPNRIAVCTRFLRGTCKVTQCPFSHTVSPEKLPVCSYFLKGICNRDKCPYSHVKVSKDAKICEDFIQGYCPLGNNCRRRHTLICPEFRETGNCSRGKLCPLKHRAKTARVKRARSTSADKDGVPSKRAKVAVVTEKIVDDVSVPFKDRVLPSFISLATSGGSSTAVPQSSSAGEHGKKSSRPMIIKPRL